MYHDVLPHTPGVGGGPAHFAVSRDTFAGQLDAILGSGYLGRSIEEALATGNRRVVAISFDDGDAGQYRHAFPELVDREMTATFFITTEWVGTAGYVTWDELREMKAAGMSIQSHTRTHPCLATLDTSAVADELTGAKATLDERLEQSTTQLAFPGGDAPPPASRHLIAEAGYTVVATSRWGTNAFAWHGTGPRYLNRSTIRGAPSADVFHRILEDDPWFRLRRRSRDTALRTIRSLLGPVRYARWRSTFLERVG